MTLPSKRRAVTDTQKQINAIIEHVGGLTPAITDHGALTGLEDDDHPQYQRKDSSSGWFPFGPGEHTPSNISASPAYPYMGTIGRGGTARSWALAWRVNGSNDASNYWTILLYSLSGVHLLSFTTAGGAPNTWHRHEATGMSVALTTDMVALLVRCDKTGSPGNLYLGGPALFVE